MSGDADQQYFSDGITEDIITELSRFRQLHVLSRNTSFRYRGDDIDMVKAGRELGAQYLVEGSVRRLGTRIRITAQLIDAESGKHIWAERYDRPQDDIFAVQDLVVRAIAAKSVERLQSAGAELAKRKPPASLAAYEYVLRADALAWHDPATKAEARHYCEKAIEIDPGYARAYAHLSQILGFLAEDSGDRRNMEEEAFKLAVKAVTLDENDSRCHVVLGDAYLQRRSFAHAERHYERALDLNPSNPNLLAASGSAFSYLGEHERGLQHFAEARALDPLFDPSWYAPVLGVAYFHAHRYDDAIAALLCSTAMPQWVRSYLAAAYAHTSSDSDARHEAEQILKASPNYSARSFLAGEPLKRDEDRDNLLQGLLKAGLPE
jgi:TolB-like protein